MPAVYGQLSQELIVALFHPGYFVPCSTRGPLRPPLVFAKLDKLETFNLA